MNDTNRRLFITIFLCLAVAYAWSIFVEPRLNPAPSSAEAVVDAGNAAVPTPQPIPEAAKAAVPAADVSRGTAAVTEPAFPRPPTRLVTISSDKLRVELTSDGAALRSAQLIETKYLHAPTHGAEKKPVELISSTAAPFPFSIEIASAVPAGGLPSSPTALLLPADTGYEVVDQNERSVTFRAHGANGLEVTKRIALDPQAYKLDVLVEVHSAQPLVGRLSMLSTGWSDPSTGGGGFFSSYFSARVQPAQAMCKAGKDLEDVQVAKPKSVIGTGQAAFAGINEQYFLLATVPANEPAAACRIDASATGSLTASLDMPLAVAAGATQSVAIAAFAGPKLGEALDQVSPVLRESIDLGFWGIIVRALLIAMRFFHTVPPHNWGVAIILLTISLKALTFPLTHKQMKSMQEMQRLAPQLEELKKKFAGDTTRQNQEQMKLYQEHGVNPMASCLPMLIQLPIWFALYKTLQVSAELYNSAFIAGWLDDLTAKDPFFIVPAVMGVTMIITQILTPTPTSNPSQKTITYAMSAFFTLAMFNLPSGLTLYILVNNILSISQQIYLRRSLKIGPAAAQTVVASARR